MMLPIASILHPRLPEPLLSSPNILLFSLEPPDFILNLLTFIFSLSTSLQRRHAVPAIHILQPPEAAFARSVRRHRRAALGRRIVTAGDVARFRSAGSKLGAAEKGGQGGEAGADEANVELDGAEDDGGDRVPNVVGLVEKDDAVGERDDGAAAGARSE